MRYCYLIIGSLLLLAACSSHYPDSTKVPAKYKPKKLNPHPKYFMTVKGFIDPRLQKHIHLTIVAEYNNYNPKCNLWVSHFNGVDGPWQLFHNFPAHPNKQGYYQVKVPLDYYQPGKCDWHAATVRYKTNSEKDVDASILAFLGKRQVNSQTSSGSISFDCSYGYASCAAKSASGLGITSKTISYEQQIAFHLNFYYKRTLP